MRINSAKEVGLLIRDRRRSLGQTQQQLANRARVGRPWLSEVERGKARAELSLVLRVLRELGILLDAAPEDSSAHGSVGVAVAPAARLITHTGSTAKAPNAATDIDAIVDGSRAPS